MMADENRNKIIIEANENGFAEEQEKKKTIKVLSFSLDRENYCIAITSAIETIKVPSVTRVPNTPGFIVGVVNIRGEIMTLIDIRYFFGLTRLEHREEAEIIITDVSGALMGVLVDKIQGVIEIEEEAIQPPLATFRADIAEYIRGEVQIGKDMLVFLNLVKILTGKDIELLKRGEE